MRWDLVLPVTDCICEQVTVSFYASVSPSVIQRYLSSLPQGSVKIKILNIGNQCSDSETKGALRTCKLLVIK